MEPGHKKNSYEAGPFVREIDNRRTAQDPTWTDGQTNAFMSKSLQGPAYEWYGLFLGRAQNTDKLNTRKQDWQACMREWRSNYHLTGESHRTSTVDLFRYDQGMHPRHYHLKVANRVHRLLDQNQQWLWHNTFPNHMEATIFVPTKDRNTNQVINLEVPANAGENMDNVKTNQRATFQGASSVNKTYNRRSTWPRGTNSSGSSRFYRTGTVVTR